MSRFARGTPARLLAERVGVLDEAVVLSKDECADIVSRALKASRADACRVTVSSQYQTNLRFADNQMSTSGISDDVTITVTAVVGRKRASATTNDSSPEGLARVVAQAEALARLAPDDPELLPELGAQQYRPVTAWFDSTAQLTAEARARAAMTALGPARSGKEFTVAGYIECSASAVAIGTSAGCFAHHRATNANYTLTVRTNDGTGSGWAAADANDWARIDFNDVSARAIAKARASRNPVAIEPGRYTVIFEPQAVSDLLGGVRFAFNARAADEGRSPFSKAGGGTKLGERIVDPRITMRSDPFDAQLPGTPFDGDGLPLSTTTWVQDGVLSALGYDRFYANKMGKAPTGNGGALVMAGGDTPLAAMIAKAERAVVVTRLWYLRPVNQRQLTTTGLTRDGTFLVENGKIARSIKNFRFNDSPLFLLNNIEALGPTVRTGEGGTVVPPVMSRDFNFTSLSDAV
ncbi:MAG: TldD/PmbA family protein [Gemmatimonadaceae bacterium]|nr:TldD/PmbA family protein [Gemmatimonadaceae bacterium]